MSSDSGWLSTGKAGKLLGCDPKTVAKMCSDGIFAKVRRTRVGGPWRIPKSEVIAHAARMEAAARADIEAVKPKKRGATQ